MSVVRTRGKNRGLLGLCLWLALWGCQPVYVKSLFPPTLSYAPAKERTVQSEPKQTKQQPPAPAPAASAVASAPTPEATLPPEEPSEASAEPSSGAGSAGSSSSNGGEHLVKQQPPSAPNPPALKEAPKGPVLTLAPGGNPADAARSKERAQNALKRAIQELTTVDRAKIAGQNAADYDLVSGLIKSAQEALKDEDSVRAQGLAEKAAALAEQLSSRIATPH